MAGLVLAAGSLFMQAANSRRGGGSGTVVIPDPTSEEQQMIDLLRDAMNQFETRREEELPLQAKLGQYQDILFSDSALSDDELAMFDEEYNARLEAFKEEAGMKQERLGASRLAELASRGVLETTTGGNIIAEDTKNFSDYLSGGVSEILGQKEIAKSDAERAKREMAMHGYNLTSGILQSRLSSDLSNIGALQDYQSSLSRIIAQNSASKIIRENTLNQSRYNLASRAVGSGAGLALGAGYGGLR